MTTERGRQVVELSKQASELFAGHDKNLVALALADLLSIWLLSHFVENDREATTRHRTDMLVGWLQAVNDFVGANEADMGFGELIDGPGPVTRH